MTNVSMYQSSQEAYELLKHLIDEVQSKFTKMVSTAGPMNGSPYIISVGFQYGNVAQNGDTVRKSTYMKTKSNLWVINGRFHSHDHLNTLDDVREQMFRDAITSVKASK